MPRREAYEGGQGTVVERFAVDVSRAESKIKIRTMTKEETCPQSTVMIMLKYEAQEPLLTGYERHMSSSESIPCFGGGLDFASNTNDQQ